MNTTKIRNPLRIIFNTAIFLFFIFILSYIGVKVVTAYEVDAQLKESLNEISGKIENISIQSWDFLKPFLQLIIILLIAEWMLGKFNISLADRQAKIEWNIQTIIALIIISAFALAALSDIPGVSSLKDIALVVVGFYFGSQRKAGEPQSKE